MHQKCTYGSVGASGGQLPEATWPQDLHLARLIFRIQTWGK